MLPFQNPNDQIDQYTSVYTQPGYKGKQVRCYLFQIQRAKDQINQCTSIYAPPGSNGNRVKRREQDKRARLQKGDRVRVMF